MHADTGIDRMLAQVEDQIMAAYVDSKTAQMEPVLQDFLYADMAGCFQTPLPSEPRDVCLELHFNLVQLHYIHCVWQLRTACDCTPL